MENATYTVNELLSYLVSRERKLETASSRKKYITFCNTVSIKLLQLKSLQSALEVCLKGLVAGKAFAHSPLIDSLWPGRILTLNILGYSYYLLEKPTEGLKFLYDGQVLLQTTKESSKNFSLELHLLSTFITYLCLWKINRKAESLKYLETAMEVISRIRSGKVLTKLPLGSIDNMYGITSVAMCLGKVDINGNVRQGVFICEQCLNDLGEEVMSRKIVRQLLGKLKNFKINPYACVDSEVNEEVNEIFLISMFLPMMSPNSPNIQEEPLKIESRVFRKTSNGSKRSSSRGSNAFDFTKNRGSSYQYSPASRPRSGVKIESVAYTRPRSSYGFTRTKK